MEQREVVKKFIRSLKEYGLTRQQIKTLRGLALSGNVDGAEIGLKRLLARRTG